MFAMIYIFMGIKSGLMFESQRRKKKKNTSSDFVSKERFNHVRLQLLHRQLTWVETTIQPLTKEERLIFISRLADYIEYEKKN